jgi:hypothetical protein
MKTSRTEQVAYNFNDTFTLIAAPSIWQCDYGREFVKAFFQDSRITDVN